MGTEGPVKWVGCRSEGGEEGDGGREGREFGPSDGGETRVVKRPGSERTTTFSSIFRSRSLERDIRSKSIASQAAGEFQGIKGADAATERFAAEAGDRVPCHEERVFFFSRGGGRGAAGEREKGRVG